MIRLTCDLLCLSLSLTCDQFMAVTGDIVVGHRLVGDVEPDVEGAGGAPAGDGT